MGSSPLCNSESIPFTRLAGQREEAFIGRLWSRSKQVWGDSPKQIHWPVDCTQMGLSDRKALLNRLNPRASVRRFTTTPEWTFQERLEAIDVQQGSA